jgi:hypothetical protein
MTLAHKPFVTEAFKLCPDAWITYATYVGFVPQPYGKTKSEAGRNWWGLESWRMGCSDPEFGEQLDPRAICQWTLTQMIHGRQAPLAEWLDEGRPEIMRDAEHWPSGLRPPTARNVGFIHQGSQWTGTKPTGTGTRYKVQLSAIKEACLRATESGLEGVAIHGEVSSRCIPYELNYLGHAYFSRHPDATLRQFGIHCLGPILGGESAGERFVELLARAEAGICNAQDLGDIERREAEAFEHLWRSGGRNAPLRYWRWLLAAATPGHWGDAQVYQLSA